MVKKDGIYVPDAAVDGSVSDGKQKNRQYGKVVQKKKDKDEKNFKAIGIMSARQE